MKLTHLILITLLAFGLTACKGSNDHTAAPAEQPATPAHAEAAHEDAAAAQQPTQLSGTVLETMNTAGYTYIKVKTETEEVWAAAPEFPVEVGDKVMIPQGMAMPNYHSNTLNRDFDVVYFVSDVLIPGKDTPLNAPEGMGMDMAHQKPAAAEIELDFSGLTKPENGYTIAEIFAQKDQLATKEVTLHAKVVKFSPKIMKTNWIHLQDGTGEAGSNDLTITTSSEAAVGDTVLVKGILDLNQDFGYGYQYDLIIQDATITIE